MKRVLYSIPVLLLLALWAVIAAAVLWVGFKSTPTLLIYLVPIDLVMVGAFYIHRRRSALGQHFVAALGASAILFAPLLLAVSVAERPVKYKPAPEATYCAL